MSRERELLQTALGILEAYEWGYGGDHHKSPEASILNDIRKLLAQHEQEPEAWMLIDKETGARIPKAYKPEHGVNKDRWELYPLFTRPQKCKFLSVKQVKDLWETTFKSAVPYYTFYEICVAIITALE